MSGLRASISAIDARLPSCGGHQREQHMLCEANAEVMGNKKPGRQTMA
jgi:hypothetical protein